MLVRRRPFGYFDDLGYFDDDLTYDFRNARKGLSVPAVNVQEKAGAYEIEVAMPGMKKEDFSISVHDNVLTLGAEAKTEKKDKAEHYTCKEFSFTSFKRSFSLPEGGVDQDAIEASYRDGILRISLPRKKAPTQDSPKEISVR